MLRQSKLLFLGSGKTLAYLLPVLQRMDQQVAANGGAFRAQERSPLIVIMTPTTELAA